LGLVLPGNMSELLGKYRDKGKMIVATVCALTATTMALVTFMSGGGVDDLAAADSINWKGPVGLLDSDYQHLVTIGKINRATRLDEYVSGDVRDPMTPPKGALKSKKPAHSDASKAPAAPTTLPNMWLSGIIWDSENPIVIIDGLDLREGDRIKGARVVEIRMDNVVLSYAGKEYVLTVD
jgi:hypothetical protein